MHRSVPPTKTRRSPASDSEDVARQVLVLQDLVELLPHVRRVDADRAPAQRVGLEAHVLQHLLHHGVQAAGADVLRAVVHHLGDARQLLHAALVESQLDALGARSAAYWRVMAFLGCVRMRTRTDCVSGSSSTRMGKRPCSSGSRSLTFATWKAPAAMNRTWSVFTGPYLVFTVEPSTSGKRSRCTPPRDTSGP